MKTQETHYGLTFTKEFQGSEVVEHTMQSESVKVEMYKLKNGWSIQLYKWSTIDHYDQKEWKPTRLQSGLTWGEAVKYWDIKLKQLRNA